MTTGNTPERPSSPTREPGSRMRASDADRDRVVERLREAFAEGRITAEEHTERLDAVQAAKTMGELEPITEDLPLPMVKGGDRAPAARGASRGQVQPSGDPEATDTLVGVFGGSSRKGRWRVRRRTRAVAVFGGHDIDMTEAVFDAPVVEFTIAAMFGGVDIKVPPGVEIRNRAIGVFGGFDVDVNNEGLPDDAPVLVIKGFALFGGASVKHRTPRLRR